MINRSDSKRRPLLCRAARRGAGLILMDGNAREIHAKCSQSERETLPEMHFVCLLMGGIRCDVLGIVLDACDGNDIRVKTKVSHL